MKTLFEHIKDGEIQQLRELITGSPFVLDSTSPKNLNPLSYSIVTSQPEAVTLFLKEMSVEQINNSGKFHPLSLAIQYNEEKIIEELLLSGKMQKNTLSGSFILDAYDAKCSPEIINKISNSFFEYNDEYMGYNVFSHLFNFPSNHDNLLKISKENLKKCITPEVLNVIIESQVKPEHIKTIMDASIDINDNIKDIIFQRACESMNMTSAKSLLDMPGFYPDKQSRDALITAVINFDNPSKPEYLNVTNQSLESKNAYKFLKEFIIENQISINDYQHPQGDTVLNLAIIKNDSELFNYFLEKGADVNEINGMGNNALLTALTYNISYFDKVMEESPDLKSFNKAKNTALIIAAQTCNNYALNTLASKIGFKEDRNQDGHTAMHISILNKNADAISTLLWHNASIASTPLIINKKNTSTTIEDDLAKEENLEDDIIVFNSFKQLALHGFNPNQTNHLGDSFPHHFIKHGATANLLSIIELNIDPNIVNANKENILMVSAKSNNTTMFNAILEKFKNKIDFTQINNEGKDIYTILQERKDINRLSNTLIADPRFKNNDKEIKKILSNVLPMITFAGDITPHMHLINEWSKENGPIIDKVGNSLLVAAIASGKTENFKVLSEHFSHHILFENNNNKNGLSFLKNIESKNKDLFNEYCEILSRTLGKDLLVLQLDMTPLEQVKKNEVLTLTLNIPHKENEDKKSETLRKNQLK